ncbi:MAG: ImmA/IrrE family metallo-endopeptidase [Actinomycetota bacterium]|nr:ImmA/IrrE family metallo-endopeptidase [Actinomycetota bacterium]
MSPRPAHPHTAHQHEVEAAKVLALYHQTTKTALSLPIPIELIIEIVYDLRIVSEVIPEQAGERILGILQPADRTILLNQQHEELLAAVIGPEQFTLAHELGHWLYDADDPAQGQLFDPVTPPVFCRDLTANRDDPGHLREVNANKLASALLMPKHLILQEIDSPFVSHRTLSRTAANWGVSAQALTYRLEALNMRWCLPDPM